MIYKYIDENGIVDDLPYGYSGVRSYMYLEKFGIHITEGSSNSGAYKRQKAITVNVPILCVYYTIYESSEYYDIILEILNGSDSNKVKADKIKKIIIKTISLNDFMTIIENAKKKSFEEGMKCKAKEIKETLYL